MDPKAHRYIHPYAMGYEDMEDEGTFGFSEETRDASRTPVGSL